MKLPREIAIGRGKLEGVPGLCSELQMGRKCLVITGKNTYHVAGKKLAKALAGNFEVGVEKVGAATRETVERVLSSAREESADFLVGVGGGKCIDVTKLASKLAGVEFISVPTSASHDGMASARASIRDGGNTVSRKASTPMGVVVDTRVVKNSPYRLLASGYADVLSKLTAVKDWELASRVKGEPIDPYALAIARASARVMLEAREEVPRITSGGIKKVVKALISSGMAMNLAGSSRPGSGSEHKFSHALDVLAQKPALHGEQCGVGTILAMYLHGGDWRGVREALRTVGAPTTAEELGIRGKVVVEALQKAKEIRPHRYTILEHSDLNRGGAEEVVRATGVIG